MNNVPLIQGNSTQEINTSIIALKKAAKELEDLNTLVNKKLAEVNEALSGDISDIQDKISALDLSQVGGSGYYIESLSQTDGKVSASAQAIADTVASGNAHSVSSDAVYNALNAKQPYIVSNMYNGSGSPIYYKVTNILPIQSYESVYILQARAGETIIIGCGHGDGNLIQIPKVKRLLNTYSKIGGLAYKDRDLYVQIAGYSHEVILTRLCGNYLNTDIVTSRITATEYSEATSITIDS